MAGDYIVAQAIEEGMMVESNNTFTCQVCNSSTTGIIPAVSHLQGSKHKKEVQKSKMEAAMDCDSPDSFNSSVLGAIKIGVVTSHRMGSQVVLTCVPCNKPCSGEVPLMQHLSSEAHNKKLRLEAFSSSFSSPKERSTSPFTPTMHYDSASPSNQSSSQEVAVAIKSGLVVSQQVGTLMVMTCVPCNKPCSGEVPMAQHLASEAHAKKLRQGVRTSSVSPQKEVFTTLSASPTQYKTAATADISSVQDVATAIKSGLVVSQQVGTVMVMTCVPCNKQCSGEVPMNQHLASEMHAKKIRQGVRTPSVSPQKEAPTTPSVSTTYYSTAASTDISSVQGNELVQAKRDGIVRSAEHDANHLQCLVCFTYCTGEDSMKEHLQGKAHIKKQNLSLLTSKQPLASSSISSPIHRETLQPSPLSKDGISDKSTAIAIDMSSGVHEPSQLGDNMVKKENPFDCTVCKVSCNSYAQIQSHLQGEPHKKQCRLRQSNHFLQKLVVSSEPESQLQSAPLASSTLDNIMCTGVIEPPPEFKDYLPSRSPATQVKHEENPTSPLKQRLILSTKEYSIQGRHKKLPSKKLMQRLPDIRVYTSSDSLSNMFEE